MRRWQDAAPWLCASGEAAKASNKAHAPVPRSGMGRSLLLSTDTFHISPWKGRRRRSRSEVAGAQRGAAPRSVTVCLSIHITAILYTIAFPFIIMVLHHKNKAYNIICGFADRQKEDNMNAQLTNTAFDDHRPALYFAMSLEDLRALRAWVETQTAPDLQSQILANKYRCGVQAGLSTVGLGFNLYPGAGPMERVWTDATSTVWRWDNDEMRGVSMIELEIDSRDYIDYPDVEMAAFASGMLDAITACGWMA